MCRRGKGKVSAEAENQEAQHREVQRHIYLPVSTLIPGSEASAVGRNNDKV